LSDIDFCRGFFLTLNPVGIGSNCSLKVGAASIGSKVVFQISKVHLDEEAAQIPERTSADQGVIRYA